MINTLVNNAPKPIATFVFAHGAGAGQDSEFMQTVAQGLATHNVNVIRFNFAYMQLALELGKRRPPERVDKLMAYFNALLLQLDDGLPIFIGGKSMGGRMASMILDQSKATGCICMGYPFHPPGKPEKLRTEHLADIQKPIFIIQGERDTFGVRSEVESYELSKNVDLLFLKDGDHSFKPRKASGVDLHTNVTQCIEQTAAFIKQHISQ